MTRDSTPTLTPTCPLDLTSEHLGTFPGDLSIGTQQNQTRSLSPPASEAQTVNQITEGAAGLQLGGVPQIVSSLN